VSILPQAEGFHVEVALADGFRMWGLQRGNTPVRLGQNVLACSRKEHIAVAKPDNAAALSHSTVEGVPGEQTFIGVTQAASFLGLEEEYVVSIDGIEMSAIQRACGLGAGEPVAVTIRPEDVIVFVAGDDGDRA
jgi:hypothetical protein